MHDKNSCSSDMDQYVNTIRRFGRITVEREKELSSVIATSKIPKDVLAAKNELIQSNLLLVVSRAVKIARRFQFMRVNVMDLVSEGNIALMRCASRYRNDHESHAVFSSYSVPGIDHRMIRFVNASAFIHVPYHYLKYKKQLENLRERHKGKLTSKMIMEEIGISKEMLESLRDDKSRQVGFLEDMLVGEDGESSWGDLLEDENAVKPTEETTQVDMIEFLGKYVSQLTEREQVIIRGRHVAEHPLTYYELKVKLNTSCERIRQIHHNALRKLKNMVMLDFSSKNGRKTEEKFDYRMMWGKPDAYSEYINRQTKIREKGVSDAFKMLMRGEYQQKKLVDVTSVS